MIIDRQHHVPLAAAALENEKGMYGIAIDHRIPPHEDFDNFVGLHEEMEHFHMKHLKQAGMDPVEAYHEAHDRIATPIESAAVRAHAARLGLDPDEYLDDYKSHWRAGASIAAEPTSRPRHPDAHTTRDKLDEAELGDKLAYMPYKSGVEYGGVDVQPEMDIAKALQKGFDKRTTNTNPDMDQRYKDDMSEREKYKYDVNRFMSDKPDIRDLKKELAPMEDPIGGQKERMRSITEKST